ncbi:AAA family ATPase [Actinomadura miaoliensis]|uniref:ATPase AAA-type core domain-containing protein n=1 Tax=Actinomadura miaoliensis TaxID=430685 RepID=A0ABP7UW06_9ACTN
MVAQQRLSSAILWGPPGVGKTTIARLLAHAGNLAFEPVSATFSGYYWPTRNGYETQIADCLRHWAALRAHRQSG